MYSNHAARWTLAGGWGRMWVILAAATMATATLGAAPAVAANGPAVPTTAPTWQVESSVNPTGPEGQLNAVSCLPGGPCTAVGTYTDSAGVAKTLATVDNDGAWTVQTAADPAGAAGSDLNGVSCTSADACTAVGSYYLSNDDDTYVPLTEAWNGQSWAVQPNGGSDSYYSELSAVSCVGSWCMAVGNDHYNNPISAVRSAGSWTFKTTPSPAGTDQGALWGVSCTSSADCTAVGYYENQSGAWSTLAEQWNGSSWKVQSSPNPSGATYIELSAVSCGTATTCTAVGSYDNSSDTEVTLAEVRSGSTWKVQPSPNPAGADDSYLEGVDCTGTAPCTAVGDSYGDEGFVTLAEQWNGSAWSVKPTPNNNDAYEQGLDGVACTAADACDAVGSAYNGDSLDVNQTWNGTSWSSATSPNPTGALYSDSESVSCTAAATCTSVGNTYDPDGSGKQQVQVWNGTTWKAQPAPNPTNIEVYGASCTASVGCVAVGNEQKGSGDFSFVEVRDGATWKIEPTPNPAGATYASLDGVSCEATSTACMAVGSYDTASETLPLSESWNGAAFSLHTVAVPTGSKQDYLNGVSCTSSTACIAVGSYRNGAGDTLALADSWNGTKWSLLTVPTPAGTNSDIYLDGVSCNGASCMAVGGYTNSKGVGYPLAEKWSGGVWSVQKTANLGNLSNLEYAEFAGVSCLSASDCTAVGDYRTQDVDTTALAEKWNGTAWTQQTVPVPIGTDQADLYGVSCTAASACQAVGNYENSIDSEVTLAERYS